MSGEGGSSPQAPKPPLEDVVHCTRLSSISSDGKLESLSLSCVCLPALEGECQNAQDLNSGLYFE